MVRGTEAGRVTLQPAHEGPCPLPVHPGCQGPSRHAVTRSCPNGPMTSALSWSPPPPNTDEETEAPRGHIAGSGMPGSEPGPLLSWVYLGLWFPAQLAPGRGCVGRGCLKAGLLGTHLAIQMVWPAIRRVYALLLRLAGSPPWAEPCTTCPLPSPPQDGGVKAESSRFPTPWPVPVHTARPALSLMGSAHTWPSRAGRPTLSLDFSSAAGATDDSDSDHDSLCCRHIFSFQCPGPVPGLSGLGPQ